MKKLFLLAMMVFAISCSNDATDEPQTPDKPTEQPEMVTVSFAMKGDVTIEEEPLPLSRTAGAETESKDLYGIIIYYNADKDENINDYYGYGVFDNVDDMVVSLLTGYKYQFICTLIKNGKDLIAHTKDIKASSSTYNKVYIDTDGYLLPFGWKDVYEYQNSDGMHCSRTTYYGFDATNKFVLGNASPVLKINNIRSSTISEWRYSWLSSTVYANTDRFYGETTNYVPREGGIVNMELKRCVFGAKFVVTGVSDGTFRFSVKDKQSKSSESLFYQSGIKADTTYKENIYTYRNVYECWQNSIVENDYSQDFTLEMTWERGNGVTQELDPQTITFKRNVLTTVNIRLNGGDTNNSLNMDIEDTEMKEENTDLDIDAGDMTDTPIDPTE